jgi:hypothetical protein
LINSHLGALKAGIGFGQVLLQSLDHRLPVHLLRYKRLVPQLVIDIVRSKELVNCGRVALVSTRSRWPCSGRASSPSAHRFAPAIVSRRIGDSIYPSSPWVKFWCSAVSCIP